MDHEITITIHKVSADGNTVEPEARPQGDFLALTVAFERRLELVVSTSHDASFVIRLLPSNGASGYNYPLPRQVVPAKQPYMLPVVIPLAPDGVPFDGELWLFASPIAPREPWIP